MLGHARSPCHDRNREVDASARFAQRSGRDGKARESPYREDAVGEGSARVCLLLVMSTSAAAPDLYRRERSAERSGILG